MHRVPVRDAKNKETRLCAGFFLWRAAGRNG